MIEYREKILQIINLYCKRTKVKKELLTNGGRINELKLGRFFCWKLIKEMYGDLISLNEIGREFNNKSHCTVLQGIVRLTNLMQFDKILTNEYNSFAAYCKVQIDNSTQPILTKTDLLTILKRIEYKAGAKTKPKLSKLIEKINKSKII